MRNFKRLSNTLLAAALCTSAAFAKTYSEKTYLATRPVGVNLAMEYTTWHDRAYRKHENGIHSHLQATGFYQESQNGRDLGKYFGIGNGSNSFQVGDQKAVEAGTAAVDGRFLIHKASTGDNIDVITEANQHTLAGLVTFNPRQEVWGVRFDYFQDIAWGLFLKANLPVAHVSNDMRMNICNSKTVTVVDGNAATEYSLADFFAGRVNVDAATSAANIQGPLCKAKIGCGKRSATGVADIDLALGYKVLNKMKSHFYLNLGLTIPTGRKPSGEYVFEPVYGNGGHVAFGAGFDAGVEFWHAKKSSARFLFAAQYRYLFDSTEHRTLGVNRCNFPWNVKSPADNANDLKTVRPPRLMQYYLIAEDQKTGQAVFPAANFLTQAVKVEPGSQLDAMVDLNFKSSGFLLDLGYNLFWKERESVSLKGSCDSPCVTSCDSACGSVSTAVKYGFAHPAYNTSGDPFNQTGNDHQQLAIDGKFINDNIDTGAAETPSALTHKVFAGLGYGWEISDKYPASVGIGGAYEFASDNSALETYQLWGKLGISF